MINKSSHSFFIYILRDVQLIWKLGFLYTKRRQEEPKRVYVGEHVKS